MKIKVFEEICNVFGGWYEYQVTKESQVEFVSLRTGKHALFPDDLAKLKRKARNAGFNLLYISAKSNGIDLEFVKS